GAAIRNPPDTGQVYACYDFLIDLYYIQYDLVLTFEKSTMKNFGKVLLLVFASSLLPGCQPVKVIGYSPGVEVKTLVAYKTFSFYKLSVTGNKGPNFVANFELCKKAIASQMISRGFREVDDSGDLSINIGILLLNGSQTGTIDEVQYMSKPDYSWLVNQKTEGKARTSTITVEMVDQNKRAGVWIGSISGAVPIREPAKQKRINQGIQALFEKFPVKIKS